ncbi:MAG: asparaginase [Bdellovibrionales bacterium]|nr:asparaginase [Bdellovibrionales bacterium]
MSTRKKILILHTGGTLGMTLAGTPDDEESFTRALKQYAPRIFETADVKLEILLNKDSSNICPRDWVLLSQSIHKRMNDWDGFVVTHGTDTLAFTASVLSFILAHAPKPIILTGSQRPLADPNSDAPRNIINAVEMAACGRTQEVCIFFDSVLLRGNRAKKVSIPSFGAFDSPNHPPLARIGMKTEFLAPGAPVPAGRYTFDPRLETNVLSFPLFPGINTEFFFPLIDRGLKGLVLQAFGPGDIPLEETSVVHLIRSLTERGVPTVICSQAVFGAVDISLYETGRAARDAGAISAGDMTWETCMTKMMALLGRGHSLRTFSTEFQKNLVGELTE